MKVVNINRNKYHSYANITKVNINFTTMLSLEKESEDKRVWRM